LESSTPDLPDNLPADPLPLIESWIAEAGELTDRPNPNAMSLATASPDGQPNVRVVLAKEINVANGYIVFYTNYNSPKGDEIEHNPKAAAAMHWDSLGRQIRLQGLLTLSPAEESDAYFLSRDRGSQVGAWASEQSAPIESREALQQKFGDAEARFEGQEVPRPPHWGGYRLWPTSVELWISRSSRLHERALWTREVAVNNDEVTTTAWQTSGRLQP